MAKKGISFILQGPPGTGKSQTITNIIAESLAVGKKVLFVSEKMAALDVVHRRLRNAELDDFCLVLHSHKANKKNVLEQLRKVFRLNQQKNILSQEAHQKLALLQADKIKLNEYVNQLHQIIYPLEKSIYEVNGILAGLEDYEYFIFSIHDVRNVTKEQYEKYCYLLSQFASTIGEMSNDHQQNPWRESALTSISYEFRHDINARLPILLSKIKELDTELEKIIPMLHLDFSHTLHHVNDIITILSHAELTSPIPAEWILTYDLPSLLDEIDNCADLKEQIAKLEYELSEKYASIQEKDAKASFSDIATLNSCSSLEEEKFRIHQFSENTFPYSHWSDITLVDIKNLFYQAKKSADTIQRLREKLLNIYEPSIFALDYQALADRIKIDYQYFSHPFKNDIAKYWILKKKFCELSSLLSNSFQFIQDNDNLITLSSVDLLTSHNALEQEKNILSSFLLDTLPYCKWTPGIMPEVLFVLNNAKTIADDINMRKNFLFETYEPGILALDYQGILERFQNEYQSFTKIFKKEYKQDQKAVLFYRKDSPKKLSDDDIISLAEALQKIHECEEWYNKNCEELNLYFAKGSISANTNYSVFETGAEVFSEIHRAIRYIDQMIPICDEMEIKEKVLKKYEQDQKAIQVHQKDFTKKITDEDTLALVEDLRKLRQEEQFFLENSDKLKKYFGEISEHTNYDDLEKKLFAFEELQHAIKIIDQMHAIYDCVETQEILFQNHYQFLYNGIKSDWSSIRKLSQAAIPFQNIMRSIPVPDAFVSAVCRADDFIKLCQNAKKELETRKWDMFAEYQWFSSHFLNPEAFEQMEFDSIHHRWEACLHGLSLLEEWIDYSQARRQCIENGLEDFIDTIEAHNIPVQNIVPIFKKRFFRLWLDAVQPEYPAVLHFRRKNQEETIKEFASLDRKQFEIAKARIRIKLIDRLPSLEHFTSGLDEVSILKRELNKQRKIMPIRRLFRTIPNLMMTLKPCLMMSPLSVSLFLEADTYQFDIVIFDEASQVCTENAIGAISRAKQVVIAGDSKQLPPTAFFQNAVSEEDFDSDDDEYELDDINAYESVLDEANMLPERTLRFHYRSRHESLIAFSNAKIYKNNLITFPSNVEKAKNIGVEYVYVPNGYYDRGGKKGNIAEANKVADLVFRHFKECPERSLGVIAFGERQQQAIENVIRERRWQNPEFETLFSEDKENAFFIKNLENVQGDERDTIIFSVGYGKDTSGVFKMNFGPLTKAGGERRLNVAITRAKYNVKLVGSIMPTDIPSDKSDGLKLLRNYIDFAINGQTVLQNEVIETNTKSLESPFEESVYHFLIKKGYQVATQVGCSEYRIDLAVKHPTLQGIYVLGIECDGASYHSARTARERDRLRQDVLEHMGWNIYRIWSTDWIKDSITEGEKLIEVIENAISKHDMVNSDQFLNTAENDPNPTEIDFVHIEENKQSVQISKNPYGFETTEITDFSSLPLDQYSYLSLTDCIMEVIHKEYPVHFDILCQRLLPLFGNDKITVKVRRETEYGLSKLKNKILRKGDFLFPSNYQSIPVRFPNNRKIQHISVDELSEAMFKILQTCIGTTKDALCAETRQVYGFNRTSKNISSAMEEAFELLLQNGKTEELDGKLKIKN